MTDPALQVRMATLIFGAVRAKTLYVAVKLGIADELADGPLPVEELAERSGTNADALYRVMRALAGEDLFEEVAPGTFALTEFGGLLREDAPGSRRYLSLMFAEQTDRVFEHMLEAVRTGQPAAKLAFGKPYFDWLADDPEASETFNKAMQGGAALRIPTLLSLDLWSNVTQVCDVGGGNGTAMVALLETYPHLKGLVFDLPHVRGEAETTLAAAGLTDRCEFVDGNFFESVPAGMDVYVMLQILHDWSDEEAVRILRTCREAIPEEGRLVVVEQIVPAGLGGSAPAWLDIQMLVLLGGRERTEEEWRDLLAAGDFEVDGITSGVREAAITARPNSSSKPAARDL